MIVKDIFKMLDNIKDTLFELCSKVNIANYNGSLEEYLVSLLKEYSNDVYVKNGNVIANFGNREEGKPHILLDAHLDQIGMMVTYITQDGFLKVGSVGGLDRRLLSAQEVTVHGKKDILGVISTLPPHLSSNSSEVPKVEELCIDTGLTKEELQQIVSLGDVVSFRKQCHSLIGDRVTAPSLDDRSGIMAILTALSLLKDESLNCSYTVMFSSQEEVGERGALIGAYEINPDYAIAVDVSFGLTADESPYKCGLLGGGAMIGFSSTLDKAMSKDLQSVAIQNNIPYQIEVMPEDTGTNADRLSVTRNGVKSATLSIPLKYMHTPVEVIDLNDVLYTARLISAYLKTIK